MGPGKVPGTILERIGTSLGPEMAPVDLILEVLASLGYHFANTIICWTPQSSLQPPRSTQTTPKEHPGLSNDTK